jgi:ribokinase
VSEVCDADLLVFGDTAIDYFYQVKKIPKVNQASDVVDSKRFYGGMGANTAVIASALGVKTGLVSVIGTDAEDYIKYMENLGLRLYLKGVFGETTRSMFFKENGNSISFFYKGVTEMLDQLEPGKTFDKSIIRDAKVVYMCRTYLNLQKKVVKSSRGKYVVYNPGYGVFDFASIPKDFTDVLKHTNVLILNQHELEHLKTLGFRISFKLGPQVFIITKGERGCSVYAQSTEIDIGTYRTKVMDEAGAGDAFNAGYMTGILRGHDIYSAAKIGAATASFVIEKWGCQTNIPSWDAVMKRYNEIQ